MTLGNAIKVARQKAYYTQEQFADELNVALSTVNRWEMDKARPNISKMKLIKEFCENRNLSYTEIEFNWLHELKEGDCRD